MKNNVKLNDEGQIEDNLHLKSNENGDLVIQVPYEIHTMVTETGTMKSQTEEIQNEVQEQNEEIVGEGNHKVEQKKKRIDNGVVTRKKVGGKSPKVIRRFGK